MSIDQLRLLPRPWRLVAGEGAFALTAATRIQTGAKPADATTRTARGLQSALMDAFGLALPIVPADRPAAANAISLVLEGRDDAAFPAGRFGWTSPSSLGAQSYTLRIGENGAVVVANDEAGLFYGVQTLMQVAASTGRRWPGLAIKDRPVLATRGLMLDVSRGKVPTVASLADLVRRLAHYKFNHVQFYTEHTFQFPSHPEPGANAGSLTPDDVVAIDAVCRELHIELVPNLQSVGHQRALLKLPRYAHLAETGWNWSLATAREETFALLDEFYGDLLPCFRSRWFNVDADEPWDIGLGQSRALTDEIGVGRVYLHYVQRLHQLVTKHGHRMMMWADVLKHHPELMDHLPRDILLLDWWYERREHHETLDALAASGRPFWVCPGASSWGALFPRLDNAFANILDYTREGIAAGASGMLLTEWGDGGHYQMPANSWYPYLWGAEVAWTGGETARDDFDAAFDRLFLGDGSGELTAAFRRLGALMQTETEWLTSWNSALALWEEPLDGKLATITPPETVAATRAAALALLPLLHRLREPALRHEIGFTAALIAFATEKVDTTRAVRDLLANLATHLSPSNEGRARFTALRERMTRQRDELPALVAEFSARWHAYARTSEIGITLDRYAALTTQYDVALAWLERQQAIYEAGGTVDAALATYNRGDYAVLHEATRRWVNELVGIVGFDALPADLQGWLRTVV